MAELVMPAELAPVAGAEDGAGESAFDGGAKVLADGV
jgi:hypothetical protein